MKIKLEKLWFVLLLADLSPCFSAIENFVGAKSPPGSEHGRETFRIGFHGDKCLNVSGPLNGISFSFFFTLDAFDLVSQNKIWLFLKN